MPIRPPTSSVIRTVADALDWLKAPPERQHQPRLLEVAYPRTPSSSAALLTFVNDRTPMWKLSYVPYWGSISGRD